MKHKSGAQGEENIFFQKIFLEYRQSLFSTQFHVYFLKDFPVKGHNQFSAKYFLGALF